MNPPQNSSTTMQQETSEEKEPPPAYTPTNDNDSSSPNDVRKDDNNDNDGDDGGKKPDGLTACLKRTLKLVRSIGGLIVFLLAYTFLGAWVMMTIEGPAEVRAKQKVYNVRESIAEELKNNTELLQRGALNGSEWNRRTEELLLHLETTIHGSGVASTSKTKWTFFGAVLFCVTTYTTIGYGNIAPATEAGRVVTMLYATLGIPLALIVLANLGKHFTVAIKFMWGFIRRYYYTGYCRKARHGRRSYGMSEEANAGLNGQNLQHEGSYTKSGEMGSGAAVYSEELDGAGGDYTPGKEKETGSKLLLADVDGVKIGSPASPYRKDTNDVTHSQDRANQASSIEDSQASMLPSDSQAKQKIVFIDQEELNEDFHLPVLVAVGFIFAYIFLGAGMYRLWEDWTYLESFYFVFITTSTIGFGDVLPEHPNFFLLSCVYTFLGLALVSMTINVITEWMYKTIDTAKEKVELAKEKAMEKAKAATDMLTEVGHKAKHKVLETVGREGSASPQLKSASSKVGLEAVVTTTAATAVATAATGQESAQIGATVDPFNDGGRSSSLMQEKGGGEQVTTPGSDNEVSFRTALDYTASSDTIDE